MPQSIVENYIHIVFSTKNREPFIQPEIEDELYSYLGGVCKNMKCPPIKIGGYTDHVHILCRISQTIALMKLLEQVKSSSSLWIKSFGEDYLNFYWQSGYGAFSVNPKDVEKVEAYIANQKKHHALKSFKNEFRDMLKKYQVEYDERYVWD